MSSDLKIPEYWLEDVEDMDVDYNDRDSSDYVISGPLGEAVGPGRRFETWAEAEDWVSTKFGERNKGRPRGMSEESARWAFVIRRRV